MSRVVAALLAAALTAARTGPPEEPVPALPPPGAPVPDASAHPVPVGALAASVVGPTSELVELQAFLAENDPLLAGVPELGAMALGALPPAPTTVVRETRYYGTVTIDHRAHLARRARCPSCHGPGPVRKIEFTPKIAHERCIGCHQRLAAGPEKCQGCHVRPPPPAQLAAAPAAAAPAAPAAPPKPPEPNPENVAGALAAFDAPRPLHRMPDPFTRRVEVGFTAGTGVGAAVRFVSTQDWFVLSESVELLRSGSWARSMLLFTGGACRPWNRDVMIETSAVAGLDVLDRPVTAAFPAVGARAAVQFRQPARFLGHVTASVTWTADLSRRAFGREVGGHTVYGSVAMGLKVP